MIYTARYETMRGLLDYLSENCCAGAPASPSDKGRGPAPDAVAAE
jgi:hypothetical protein